MTSHEQDTARDLARGICRFLDDMGYRTLTEFTFGNGRRADVLAVNPQSDLAVVEIKSSLADLRADGKWPDYRPYCDVFYFGVAPDFPRDALPDETGILVADRYGAVIEREPPRHTVHASRRRSVVLNFGLVAAARLHQQLDPDHTVGQPF
jgi:hypothetical protein